MINFPVLLFTGSCTSKIEAKTACGLLEWRPERCVGQYDSDALFLGIDKMTISAAVSRGAQTLLVGCATFDGKIDEQWLPVFEEALSKGMDVACGLHDKLSDIPYLVKIAKKYDQRLIDFRHREIKFPKGTGQFREGYRVLTVGTDCSCGKKYTALKMYTEHLSIDSKSPKFCSTGQTGFLISDNGINNDTIVADFLSGAAEYLSPSDKNAVYYIEGQGTILHPSYCGGSLSLLAGSQPDMLILCHTVGRKFYSGLDTVLAGLKNEFDANLYMAKKFNSNCIVGGISLNFSETYMSQQSKEDFMLGIQEIFACDVFDPKEGLPESLLQTIMKNSSRKGYVHG